MECGDDSQLHGTQARLQNVLDGEIGSVRAKRRFVERYKRGEFAVRFHAENLDSGIGHGLNFCALVESDLPSKKEWASSISNGVFISTNNVRYGDVEVTVFVDIREFAEISKPQRRVPSIVRLHALDECKCLFGNTGKCVVKEVVGEGQLQSDGRIAFSGSIKQQRELAPLFPTRRELDAEAVQLDEIECQMVKRRSKLVDNLASDYRDIVVGSSGKVELSATLRLGNGIRFGTLIVPQQDSDLIKMFRYPDDFELSGFNPG